MKEEDDEDEEAENGHRRFGDVWLLTKYPEKMYFKPNKTKK